MGTLSSTFLALILMGKHAIASDLLKADGNAKDNKMSFYGYIGIVGHLEKDDFDTRNKTLVKSTNDIETITDGLVHGA